MMRQDKASLYKLNCFDNIELLSATYVNQRFPLHSHDTYCIGILEEGAQILSFPSKDLVVVPQSVILINPNEVHANYALDEKGWRYRMMYVNADILQFASSYTKKSNYTNIHFGNYILQDESAFCLLKSLFNLFERNLHEKFDQQLSSVLSHLVSNYATDYIREEKDCQGIIKNLKGILNENFDTELKLDKVARDLGVSKFKIIRDFKTSTGMTPFAYVLQKRITKAKELICKNMRLSEVALESGFYDQSHFCKYFKSYVGVTPVSYLKSCNILQDINRRAG